MLKNAWAWLISAERWQGLCGRVVLFTLVSMATLSLEASASVVAPPVVTVGVGNPMGDPTTTVRANGLAYNFNGLVWSLSAFLTGVDVYFGVILPDKTTVMTWAPNNGVIVLNKGLIPFGRTANDRNFDSSAYLGHAIYYTPSGNEPLGLYWLFLIMVKPGEDPNDPRQWESPVGIQPFFFDGVCQCL